MNKTWAIFIDGPFGVRSILGESMSKMTFDTKEQAEEWLAANKLKYTLQNVNPTVEQVFINK